MADNDEKAREPRDSSSSRLLRPEPASPLASLANLVLSPPLAGASKDYQRFVVLGQQRCGTTMLVSALNDHSGVMCRGEIFHARAFQDKGKLKKLVRDVMPITYIRTVAYYSYSDVMHAVGFKLMADQLLYFRNGVLIKYLLSNDAIQLIHIWRQNTLHRYLSGIIARRVGGYKSLREPVRPNKIRLDPKNCEADFSRAQQHKEFLEQTFAGPRLLTIAYEQLVEDRRTAYSKIQQHIGVQIEAIRPKTKKQRIWSAQELISNYGELASYFAGTRWEHCFAEVPTVD